MKSGQQEMTSGSGLMPSVGDVAVDAGEVATLPAGGWCTKQPIDCGALNRRGLVEQDAQVH
jgi:hypothetical protein